MKISNKRKNARKRIMPPRSFTCPRCREKVTTGHFCAPSCGDRGFWTCDVGGLLFSEEFYKNLEHEVNIRMHKDAYEAMVREKSSNQDL